MNPLPTQRSAGPLSGIRVLDFTRYVSGPYTTMLLADAGAEVIKVEPRGGELTRFQEPMLHANDEVAISSYFLRFNRNKKSVELDPRSTEDRPVLEELIRSADVLVENFRPDALDKLGLGWDRIQELNPRLIYASISGFGHSETPNRDMAAFNLIAEAMAGTVSQNPGEAGPPRALGLPFGDSVSSLMAVIGIQQALLERHQTGLGQHIDIAMYDVMLSMNEMSVALKSMVDHDFNPARPVHDWFAPYGFFEASDGWLALCVGTDEHWRKLCHVAGWNDWQVDPALRRGIDRAKVFGEQIQPRLHAWLVSMTVSEAVEALGAAAVPVAPLQSPEQLLTDQQAAARNMLLDYELYGTRFTVVGNPLGVHAPNTTGVFSRPGEHNHEILDPLRRGLKEAVIPAENLTSTGDLGGARHAHR